MGEAVEKETSGVLNELLLQLIKVNFKFYPWFSPSFPVAWFCSSIGRAADQSPEGTCAFKSSSSQLLHNLCSLSYN